ncbi:hypothetical protein GCM10020331_050830 [Ectobacillus funiculus]
MGETNNKTDGRYFIRWWSIFYMGGILPLYWKLVQDVSAEEIFSAACIFGLLFFYGGCPAVYWEVGRVYYAM